MCTFTLCWPAGNVIRNFQVERAITVDRCVHGMEEGLIAEIPRAKTREDGSWLERFRLLWDDIDLCERGRSSATTQSPPDAILTVARLTTSTSEAGKEGPLE